jgi:glycosyltransferase involved in cell wall biosynthesis
VIDNYNYARFLPCAIESAMTQSWPHVEVVVVDDGSQDESRQVIASYGDRVRAVFKSNGGQASALNAGFVHSTGDVVVFLDADDALHPTAIEHAMPFFDDAEVVKVHWPLSVIDESGKPTGQRHPDDPLPDGDHRAQLLELGPTNAMGPPLSGNAWSRRFLDQVLPIPEERYRISADKYLLELAPFLGVIRALPDPEGVYRRHGASSQLTQGLEERLRRELDFYDDYCRFLRRHLATRGIDVDLARWKRNSWWHRQERAIDAISSLPLADGPVILVDDGAWGQGQIDRRARLPFLERDGHYWGQPTDDATAISELERLRARGATGLAFVWSTFWWLDHYRGLADYVRMNFDCVMESEDILAFDLRGSQRQTQPAMP